MTRSSDNMFFLLVFITMAVCFLANIACAVYLPETHPSFAGWNIPFVAGWLGIPGIGYIIFGYLCSRYNENEPPVALLALAVGFTLYLSTGWMWSSMVTGATL